jgi:Centromere-binding protein ParB C-terminal
MASITAPEPHHVGAADGARPAEPEPVGGLPPELVALITESARGAVDGDGSVRPRRRSRTSPDRVQRSFYLPRDLVERARAAVAATVGRDGEAYNVSQLAARGIEAEVRRLELTYNGGKPFPPVSHVPPGPSPEGVERIRSGVRAPRRRPQ